MDPGLLKRKVKTIVDEFVAMGNAAEALECLQELPTAPASKALAEHAVERALDCPKAERGKISELLQVLVSKKQMPEKVVQAAVSELIDMDGITLDDFKIDIPKVHEHFAELFAPLLGSTRSISLSWFQEVLCPIKESGLAAEVLGATLRELVRCAGAAKASDLLKKQGLDLANTTSQPKQQFIEQWSLLPLFPEVLEEQVAQKLKAGCGELSSWVKAQGGGGGKGIEPTLAHTVAKVVLEAGGDKGVGSLPSEEQSEILSLAMSKNVAAQCQCLFAAQELCCKKGAAVPADFVLDLFMFLRDKDLADVDAYHMWKDDESDVIEGKSKALFKVNQWLQDLLQSESDEEQGGEAAE